MDRPPLRTRQFVTDLIEHQSRPSIGSPVLPPMGESLAWFAGCVAEDLEAMRDEIDKARAEGGSGVVADDRPPA